MERNLRNVANNTFATALCFMAKIAMAQSEDGGQQDSGEASQEAQQATTEEIKPDLSIIDKVLMALQNPSAEFMDVYIQLGLAVALVIGAIFMMGNKKDDNFYVQLEDDVGTGGAGKAVSKKSKAKARARPTGDVQPKQGSELIEDIIRKADERKEGAANELYDELDKQGPWETDESGILGHETFIKLRKIVVTEQFKRFVVRKEELLKQRIEAYKAGREKEYVQMIQQAGIEYQQLGQMTTQEACEYIELGEQNYVSSFKNCEKRPDIIRRLQEDEMAVRDNCEPKKDDRFTRDEIKKMHMEKNELEFEMEKRMSKVMVPDKRQAGALMMIERTKIMDKLYVKYDVKLVDLMRGFKKYDLANDEDVKTQQMAQAAQMKEEAELEEKKTALTDEQLAKIKEIVEGSGGKLEQVTDEHGAIPYANFQKILSALIRVTKRFNNEKNPEFRAQRREFMEQNNETEYAKCIQENLRTQNVIKTNVLKVLLQEFGVPHQLYNKSSQFFRSDPQYAQRFMEDATNYEQAEHREQDGIELSKEEALKHIETIEEFKADTNAQLAIAMKLKQLAPPQMAELTMIAKAKAFDKLWKETGVEEEDITKAFHTYRLSETDEFKAIIEKAKQGMQAKVKAQAEKLNAAMRQASGQGMPGMPGMPGMQPGPPVAAPGPTAQGSSSTVSAETMDF